MSEPTDARRDVGPASGRLEPSVRGLLRTFLSQGVADRHAARLQPIAGVDAGAGLAGAVAVLRGRFLVQPTAVAVALAQDAGWPLDDAATLLDVPPSAVRAALDQEVGAGPAPGPVGATGRTDRSSRRTLVAAIGAVLLLGVLSVLATGVLGGGDDEVVDASGDPAPAPAEATAEATVTSSPSPAVTPELPVGPPQLAEAEWVATVDPVTGEPGATLDTAAVDDDPRLWLRFSQLPREELLLSVRFTAPSGTASVRPVLVTDRTPLVSLRLPDELDRAPGRYSVRITAEGLSPTATALELQRTGPATTAPSEA